LSSICEIIPTSPRRSSSLPKKTNRIRPDCSFLW
jgi:hypothetical protein